VVLDDFMRQRILMKGIPAGKITVIPPWSHDSDVRFDPTGRTLFRKANGLDGQFVVMYAGNHSPCHPLDTFLAAIKDLASHRDISFCFIGGGTEFVRVKAFALENRLSNVLCLPYQPLNQLASVLSAADLHLVVMGDPFVGLVHPCKAYNLLRVNAPIFYIGPRPSHISKILDEVSGRLPNGWAPHGNVGQAIKTMLELKQAVSQTSRQDSGPVNDRFSKENLLPRMVALIESTNPNQKKF
jgi:colanic acid biosynthesis glycosyl transferase WcaI